MEISLLSRLSRLENVISETKNNLFPSDDDGFIAALGINPQQFAVSVSGHCGFDFLSALTSTAADDWNDY